MDEVKLERFEFSGGVDELLPLISAEYPESATVTIAISATY